MEDARRCKLLVCLRHLKLQHYRLDDHYQRYQSLSRVLQGRVLVQNFRAFAAKASPGVPINVSEDDVVNLLVF